MKEKEAVKKEATQTTCRARDFFGSSCPFFQFTSNQAQSILLIPVKQTPGRTSINTPRREVPPLGAAGSTLSNESCGSGHIAPLLVHEVKNKIKIFFFVLEAYVHTMLPWNGWT